MIMASPDFEGLNNLIEGESIEYERLLMEKDEEIKNLKNRIQQLESNQHSTLSSPINELNIQSTIRNEKR